MPLFALLGLSVAACGGGYRSTYESCLREPEAYRDDMRRTGYTTTTTGVWWEDWGGGGIRPREPILTLTLSKDQCLHALRVEGTGVPWEQGGFTTLDESQVRQDRSGRHVGFVGHTENATYVVIDGMKSPPYRHGYNVEWARIKLGASIGPRFDRIDLQSLYVDDLGRLHYAGERGSTRVDVVDNVIVPQRTQAVAAPGSPAQLPAQLPVQSPAQSPVQSPWQRAQ